MFIVLLSLLCAVTGSEDWQKDRTVVGVVPVDACSTYFSSSVIGWLQLEVRHRIMYRCGGVKTPSYKSFRFVCVCVRACAYLRACALVCVCVCVCVCVTSQCFTFDPGRVKRSITTCCKLVLCS